LAKHDEQVAESERRDRDQAHLHHCELLALNADIKLKSRGQVFAFIIAVGFGAASCFLINAGRDWEGSLFGVSAILPLVTAFLSGLKGTPPALPKATSADLNEVPAPKQRFLYAAKDGDGNA
jgi:hypothetical protein